MTEARRGPTPIDVAGERRSEIVRDLNGMAEVFNVYFFAPQNENQLVIPTPTVVIRSQDVRTQASYGIHADSGNLSFEVAFNPKHLDLPKYALYELLLHQQVHLAQEYQAMKGVGGFKAGVQGYHNRQFVEVCQEVGLDVELETGFHKSRLHDGQFAKLMDRFFIAPPLKLEGSRGKKDNWWDIGREKPKGTSSLVKYVTENCINGAECPIRLGKEGMHVACLDCVSEYKPADESLRTRAEEQPVNEDLIKLTYQRLVSQLQKSSNPELLRQADEIERWLRNNCVVKRSNYQSMHYTIGSTTEGRSIWIWTDKNGMRQLKYRESDDPLIARVATSERIYPNDPGFDNIFSLKMPKTTKKALQAADYLSIDEVRRLSDEELLAIPGFGPTSLWELKQALASLLRN